MSQEEKPKAGCIAVFLSFTFPILGFIIYAFQRYKVENCNIYLIAAFAGIIVKAIGLSFF